MCEKTSIPCQNPWIATGLLKALATLSNTTVRRPADREDLKTVKIRKKKAFYLETLTIRAVDLSPTFLNTGTIDEAFQQPEKQDSFRHILKSLVSMHESSGSRLF